MATIISLSFAACNNNDDDLSTPVPVVSGTLQILVNMLP
jgi:hypothetical protein